MAILSMIENSMCKIWCDSFLHSLRMMTNWSVSYTRNTYFLPADSCRFGAQEIPISGVRGEIPNSGFRISVFFPLFFPVCRGCNQLPPSKNSWNLRSAKTRSKITVWNSPSVVRVHGQLRSAEGRSTGFFYIKIDYYIIKLDSYTSVHNFVAEWMSSSSNFHNFPSKFADFKIFL